MTESIIQKFSKEKNIKPNTKKGYQLALKKYCQFQKKPIEALLEEAKSEERKAVPLNDRKLRQYLIDFRQHLLESEISQKSVKTYFSKVKAFYRYYGIQMPEIPPVKYERSYELHYDDLPTKDHVRRAVEISPPDSQAVILFMASSGTSKSEVLSLTVGQFIKGTEQYHKGGSIEDILDKLETVENVVPIFYLKRNKTDKYYYTFITPESTQYLIKYLKTRQNLKLDDKLFDINNETLTARFKHVNDTMNWGFKGNYRFFRPHALRKFHASNIGLAAEYIDELQGRGKSEVHSAYIKTNPERLKKMYMSKMHNVTIFEKHNKTQQEKQEFNITINVFLSGKEYNVI